MELGITTTAAGEFGDVVERTKAALARQGFGILTEIDMAATLKAKVGAQIGDYLILGACNPPLAYQAVAADPQIGLLLPCNVVVRSGGQAGSFTVEAMNPAMMVEATGRAALAGVAAAAGERLRAALAEVAAG